MRRILAGLATALIVVGSMISSPASSAAPSPVLGVYAGGGDPPAVSAFSSTVGGKTKYAMDFLAGETWASITESAYPYPQWKKGGYKMIWGVPMLPNAYGYYGNARHSSCDGLTREAAGDFNARFVTVAQKMVNAGFANSVIRIGWEFNGTWFPWAAAGCASGFVGAYRQVVDAMRSVAGQRFTFEWNPTRGDTGIGNLSNYYPGNAYVDYIGLDVYDTEWGTYPGQPKEFEYMKTQTDGLNWLAYLSRLTGKPMVFPEWGLGWGKCSTNGERVDAPNKQVCGGDDTYFIAAMSNWIQNHAAFEATFWDYGTSSVHGTSNPHVANALRQDFG
jgi:hypothetical protein